MYQLFAAIVLVLCSGVVVQANLLQRIWASSLQQTMFEQEIEDINTVHRMDEHLVRRLIALPLSDAFNPNQASPMHNKLQYGDKCSLPTSIGRLIFERTLEVPWLFELKKVSYGDSEGQKKQSHAISDIGKPRLDKLYCSPLDFRAPENYIFLPKWMMDALDIKPNDVVDVSFVRIKLANLVIFQPLTLEWDDLMSGDVDPKVLLEHEINKYSSLTAGTKIMIEYKGVEYPLFVRNTVAEGGVNVAGVRIQDSDVNTDIDRSILDKLKKEEEAKESED